MAAGAGEKKHTSVLDMHDIFACEVENSVQTVGSCDQHTLAATGGALPARDTCVGVAL